MPVRLSGLGLVNPATLSYLSYQTSRKLTKSLIEAISTQSTTSFFDTLETAQLRREIHKSNRVHHAQEFDNLYPSL